MHRKVLVLTVFIILGIILFASISFPSATDTVITITNCAGTTISCTTTTTTLPRISTTSTTSTSLVSTTTTSHISSRSTSTSTSTSTSPFSGTSCQPVNQVTANRAQIHTEVEDLATGQIRAIYADRLLEMNNELVVILGTTSACPPQGCSPDPAGQIQDCTLSATPQDSFNWAVTSSSSGAVIPTTYGSFSIKSPSGTLVLDQGTGGASTVSSGGPCPVINIATGVPAITTMVSDITSNEGLAVVSLRTYAMTHHGSTLVDFYVVIGVNSANTFPLPPTQTQDCTTTSTNSAGWYDTYWGVANTGGTSIATLSETTFQVAGTLTLNQGT